MSKVISMSAAALALALTTSVSQAAISVNIIPQIQAAFAANPDGTVGAQLPSVPDITQSEAPAFYQVHFLVSVTGAVAGAGGQSLGGVAFGIDGLNRGAYFEGGILVPNAGLAPAPGGQNTDQFTDSSGNPLTVTTPAGAKGLYNAVVDSSGSTGTAGTFTAEGFILSATAGSSTLGFAGASGDNNQLNLEAMAFSMKKGALTATQRSIGQTTPFDVGFVDVYWDGTSNQVLGLNNTIDVNNSSIQFTQDNFSASNQGTLSDKFTGPDTNTLVFTGAAVVTPEPASLGVLALGGVALLARRKKA